MKVIKKILKKLKGKKTYFMSLVLASYGVIKAFGFVVTPEQDQAILLLIGALFAASFRNAMKK